MVPCKRPQTVRVHGLPVDRYRVQYSRRPASPPDARGRSTTHRRVRASFGPVRPRRFHEQREGRRASPALATGRSPQREARVAAALGPTLSSLLASPLPWARPVPNLTPFALELQGVWSPLAQGGSVRLAKAQVSTLTRLQGRFLSRVPSPRGLGLQSFSARGERRQEPPGLTFGREQP